MEQSEAKEEEVKTPSTAATLKWQMATASFARMRFGSSMRRLRHVNLAYPQRGRPLGRLQRL